MIESKLTFRRFGWRFVSMKKVPPDFVVEHLLRERAMQLKLDKPDLPSRRISSSVRNAVLENRSEI